jgi:hypothetical protein
MMGDIDILIPAPTLCAVLNKLTAAGYRVRPTDYDTEEGFHPGGHHYTEIDCSDWPAAIDLHVHPVERFDGGRISGSS